MADITVRVFYRNKEERAPINRKLSRLFDKYSVDGKDAWSSWYEFPIYVCPKPQDSDFREENPDGGYISLTNPVVPVDTLIEEIKSRLKFEPLIKIEEKD